VDSGKEVFIEVSNKLNARAGDHVEISVPGSSLVKMSFIVYLLPVIALVAGAYGGGIWAEYYDLDPSLLSLVSGICATGLVFYLLRLFDRSGKISSKYAIRMTRILSHSQEKSQG